MYSTKCPDCLQHFSRKDVMLRHQRHKHTKYPQSSEAYPQSSEAYPPPPPPPPQRAQRAPPPPPPQGAQRALPPPPPPPQGAQRESQIMLQHPFTMMVSGPTACGKTTFVKTLLQNHTARIHPKIKRIVWVYKRWQPLYSEIQRSVLPSVEFCQGIPLGIEDDDYFDSSTNNLLILDDIMSIAGKDQRITDLFTEGSHHRSLSVIAINQNLYASKDPTQRRNCHYLVLFNNPVDKQSIMTLARQMYPGNANSFLKLFDKAVRIPYGYLFVDLKPFTPEQERLTCQIKWNEENKNNLTNQMSTLHRQPIKDETETFESHSRTGTQPDKTSSEDSSGVSLISDKQEEMAEKMNSCDDCGLLFDTAHDVQRHVKRGWCAESMHEPPTKKQKREEIEQELEEQENIEENEGFLRLWREAQNDNVDRFNKMVDRFVSEGETGEEAEERANDKIQSYYERDFVNEYANVIETYIIPLKKHWLHHQIMKDIQQLTDRGVSTSSAVKRVLKKNKHQFEQLFETEFEEDSDEEESEEEDNEENED